MKSYEGAHRRWLGVDYLRPVEEAPTRQEEPQSRYPATPTVEEVPVEAGFPIWAAVALLAGIAAGLFAWIWVNSR